MFCGDLGNEVTDETLQRAFGKYPSFVKAKVVRDRRSNKTKGYGFASFKDPVDFTRAMREMNGQWVGKTPSLLPDEYERKFAGPVYVWTTNSHP